MLISECVDRNLLGYSEKPWQYPSGNDGCFGDEHHQCAGKLVFSVPPVGNPVLGVGVALATILSQVVALIALFTIIARMGLKLFLKAFFRPDMEVILNVLKIGLPSAGETLVYQLSTLVITYIVTWMGTEALTTRIMTFNLMSFIMIPGMSLGQGTQILVGHRVGAGKKPGGVQAVPSRSVVWRHRSHLCVGCDFPVQEASF